jgi:hypothetical protein
MQINEKRNKINKYADIIRGTYNIRFNIPPSGLMG